MSFFRYPGGKSKLRQHITSKLVEITKHPNLEYREPFFGGGSVGIDFLTNVLTVKRAWINDRDAGISCLWTSVVKYAEKLKQLVVDFIPSVDVFYRFKDDLLEMFPKKLSEDDIVTYGFKKLVVHQLSYSGLGTKSGGPLGGEEQRSKYKVDCRWSPDHICRKINEFHKLFFRLRLRQFSCTRYDFSTLITNDKHPAILYLDPPYFVKGNSLYQHGFSPNDHIRLMELLRKTKHAWVLSYDDCDEIRNLYSWAQIDVIDGVKYTIKSPRDKETGEQLDNVTSELLITRRAH